MISLDKANKIVEKETKKYHLDKYPINTIKDLGDRWVFNFYKGEYPPPGGYNNMTVDKETGKVDFVFIPPIENLSVLKKGKIIYTRKK